MFLDHRFRKHTLKSIQLHSEAMRNRGHVTPLVRHITQAETFPKQCQFPVRDATKRELRAGDETWKCLDATKPLSSYCEHHHSICYYKIQLTAPE